MTKVFGLKWLLVFVLQSSTDVDPAISDTDENLMRAELTLAERAEALAERKRLFDTKGWTTRPTLGGEQRVGCANDTAARMWRQPRSMTRVDQRLIKAAKEAQAIARGEMAPATFHDGTELVQKREWYAQDRRRGSLTTGSEAGE